MDDPLNPTLHHLLTLCRMDRTWARGEGVFLWDAAGRRFLDFYSQYGAVALGHNAPCVTQTAQQALAEGLPAMVQPYRASAAVALARELERLAPGELTRCVFTTSGAQTVETALKLVRAKSGRKVIVAAEGAFHGKTLGALALSGARQWADGFGPLPLGFEHVPYGDATALAKRLKENGPNIAALVLEPIQGEGGVILPPAGYLRQARELCTRHGVALVLDEIQTGLGRTGRLFACEHEDVAPDVLLVAKALGGGLFPLGACLASAAWWDDGFALRHSSTFANNNVACAVGLAALGALTSPGFCEAVAEQGAHLLARLERMAERYPRIVADARGRGLLCALELRAPDADDGYFLSFLHQQGLYAYAVAGVIGELASLLVLPTLGRAPVLRLAPPLTITREQLDWGLDGLESVLELLEDNAPDTIVRGLGALETKPAPATASQNGEPCPPGNQSLGMNFESVRPLWVASREAKPDGGRFAFIVHYTRPEDVPLTDPALFLSAAAAWLSYDAGAPGNAGASGWSATLFTVLALVLAIGQPDPRRTGKIKLNMTWRATRIAALAAVLAVVLWSAWLAFDDAGLRAVFTAGALAFALMPLVLVVANAALTPYEQGVQRGYRADASNRLARVQPFVIGITGSYGKSSAKSMLAHLLQFKAPTLAATGSINTVMGLTRHIRENLVFGHEFMVVEMGAYGIGSIKRLCDFTPPQAAIVTAVGDMHLERFGSLENIFLAKRELAQALPPGGVLVVNADSANALRIAQTVPNRQVFLYGETSTETLATRLMDVRFSKEGTAFVLRTATVDYECFTPIHGRPIILNLAGAFTAAVALGVDPVVAVGAFRTLKPVSNRLEVVEDRGITWIRDAYNSNQYGFRAALEVAAALPASRRVLVTPGVIELGEMQAEVNSQLSKEAAAMCDHTLVVSETNRAAFTAGHHAAGRDDRLIAVPSRTEAFRWIGEHVRPGDVVILENDLPDLYEHTEGVFWTSGASRRGQ